MRKPFRIAVALWILTAATGLGGCAAAGPSRFSTQLDTTGGIGPGDPVIHANATIGRVTGVAPLTHGDSEIGFEVDHSHASEIREDSIMLLTTQGGVPALEAFSTDVSSPAAPSGFPLEGASSENELQLFLASRGGGSVGQQLADLLKPLNTTPPGGSAPPSPAEAQMLSMFTQLSQRTIAAAAAGSPMTQAQLEQMRREAQGVERQLRRNGKTAEADRLQQQIDATLSGVGTPPNTLTIPRTNPPTP